MEMTPREIYEGDVVIWFINGHTCTAPIEFDKGCFEMGRDSKGGLVCNDWLRGEYEVIGNVYENRDMVPEDMPEGRRW